MVHGVDLISAPEAALERGHVRGQREECFSRTVQAFRVVLRRHERLVGDRREHQLILDSGYCREVVRVAGINEGACDDRRERRVELLHGDVVVAGVMKHAVDVVILIDDHDRQIAFTGVRHGDRCAAGDIDNREAVQGVAIHPDHGLLVDSRRSAVVLESVHASGVTLNSREHPIGLRTGEVVNVHPDYRHVADPCRLRSSD